MSLEKFPAFYSRRKRRRSKPKQAIVITITINDNKEMLKSYVQYYRLTIVPIERFFSEDYMSSDEDYMISDENNENDHFGSCTDMTITSPP